MRKYLKPALEIEAFDVEDIITASSVGPGMIDGPVITPNPSAAPNAAAAPIDGIELN
ncbi:MAG: hypothetical protein IKW76_13150 [Clostridia bacterium]|nr:hypothetical protein [Clostridia bacterium]